MYAPDLHKHKRMNYGQVGGRFYGCSGSTATNWWEQPLVQQQPVVQEPALRTSDQRPALRIFEQNPKLYKLLYLDGEMETLRASRPNKRKEN